MEKQGLIKALLFGGVVLIQTPDMETKTLYIDQVADKVWFVIGKDGSESVYVDELETEKEDRKWERD